MSIGDHTPSPTPQERRKVRYGLSRQVVIATAAGLAAVAGMVALALE